MVEKENTSKTENDDSSDNKETNDDSKDKPLSKEEFEETLYNLTKEGSKYEGELESEIEQKGDIFIDDDLESLGEKEIDKSKFEDFDEFKENQEKQERNNKKDKNSQDN
jgi:hypothetical protein